eukprot:2338-Heterococcus_DN1.PRE.7
MQTRQQMQQILQASDSVSSTAAAALISGRVAMLEWLATVTQPWSEGVLTYMLTAAASCDRLAAAQWLGARGAQWPEVFYSEFIDAKFMTVKQCWSASAVQSAVAAGSGWLDWKCEDYNADQYHRACDKRQAIALLKWAHANGCPCTCEQQQQQQ